MALYEATPAPDSSGAYDLTDYACSGEGECTAWLRESTYASSFTYALEDLPSECDGQPYWD